MFLGAKNQIYIFFRYYSILTKKKHNFSFKKKWFWPKTLKKLDVCEKEELPSFLYLIQIFGLYAHVPNII